MASHVIYDNVRLDLACHCIRLIEILPRGDRSETCLKFHTYPISSCPQYYALSYTWGDAVYKWRVSIDGTELYIRENLWSFFQQQTFLEESDLIWIDALCIDQGNVNERNHQVTMMAEIFSHARYVIVWLGPAADDSDTAMDFLQSIPVRTGGSAWERKLRNNLPLAKLFQRRYWRRMWIVQELRLSRGWIVLCGKKQVYWGHIRMLCTSVHEFWATNKRVKAILELGCFRTAGAHEGSKERLTTLFRKCKDQECEDPRDKIYALLGLVEYGGHCVPVDYLCSSSELYARVLISTLKCDTRFTFNSVLAQDFERDLRSSLELSSHNNHVLLERQNFLDWCWAFQNLDFNMSVNGSSDINTGFAEFLSQFTRLHVSFFELDSVQAWEEHRYRAGLMRMVSGEVRRQMLEEQRQAEDRQQEGLWQEQKRMQQEKLLRERERQREEEGKQEGRRMQDERQQHDEEKSPRTFNLNIFADANFAEDIIEAVLLAILFHRIFLPIVPLSRDLLGLTLPVIDDADLRAYIRQLAGSLIQELVTGSDVSEEVEERAREMIQQFDRKRAIEIARGSLAVRFYKKSQRMSWFGFGKHEEEVCWEQWTLNVMLVYPRTEDDTVKARQATEKSLQKTVIEIVEIVNRNKEHIPPITSHDSNCFPYQILVNPSG